MIIAVPLGMLLSNMYQEGVFDTTKNSITILVSGLNRFRELQPEDLEAVREKKIKNLKKTAMIVKHFGPRSCLIVSGSIFYNFQKNLQ